MKALAGIPPLPAFGAGLVLGLVVTVFSDVQMRRALASPPARKGTLDQKLVNAFLRKYVLDITALFLVYRNVAMLLGVAAGLLVSVYLQMKRAQAYKGSK